MPRRDDIVTIVIDTKNEMKRSVDGLGNRVNDLERDLRAAFTTEVTGLRDIALTDLRSSQQETRTSAYNAGERAGEAVAAVSDLRRDVDRLHHRLDSVSEDVGRILEILRAEVPVPALAPVPAVGSPGGPYPAQAGTGGTLGPEAVTLLPGQRRAPDQGAGPAAETAVPALAVDDPPGAETLGVPTTVEEEAEQPAPGAEGQTTPEADGREEGEQDVPRAALEAGERGSGESAEEPFPLTWEGRIWAIMNAGKVASATLICHRDTWEFVAAQVGSHPHFRTPALEERENGLVAAVLSGRSLVATLLALYRAAKAPVARPDSEDAEELIAYADWAMAYQVYYASARALSRARSGEGDPIVITIDNRVPARV